MFTTNLNSTFLEENIRNLLESEEFQKDNNPWLIFLKNKSTYKSTLETNVQKYQYSASLDKTIFALLHYNQSQIIDYFLRNNPPSFLEYLKKMKPSAYSNDSKQYQSEDIFFMQSHVMLLKP